MTANSDMPILIVDDAKFSMTVIIKCLESGGYKNIKHASNAKDALGIIKKNSIAIIIADWLMPGPDGLDLTHLIRKIDAETDHYTYIIMLTAKDGKTDLQNAFNEGVDDFINKSAMQQQLLPRIFSAGRIVRNQHRQTRKHNALIKANSLLKNQNENLKSTCVIDTPTGLGNHNFALQKLRDHLKHTKARGGASCVVLIRINPHNNALNHLPAIIVQEILLGISKRLKSSIRPLDDLARLSPFEFAIITQQPDLDHCQPQAFKRLYKNIENREFKTSMGFQSVDLTIAVVAADYDYLPKAQEMLQKARDLIQHAKENEKISYHRFELNSTIIN